MNPPLAANRFYAHPAYHRAVSDAALFASLETTLEERRRRMESMKTRLRKRTIYTWLTEFLAEAAEARVSSLVYGAP